MLRTRTCTVGLAWLLLAAAASCGSPVMETDAASLDASGTLDASHVSDGGDGQDAASAPEDAGDASADAREDGGPPEDPCDPSESVPGALIGGLRIDANSGLRVAGEHVYLTTQRSGSCSAAVLRVPKDGGAFERLATYAPGEIVDVHGGEIDASSFYWAADFRIWAVPFAGGSPREVVYASGTPTRRIAINSTRVFGAQSGGGDGTFTAWSVALAGGGRTTVHAFDGLLPNLHMAADDEALFVTGAGQLTRVPLAGGDPVGLGAATLGTVALDDDYAYVVRDDELVRIPRAGGDATVLASLGDSYITSIAVDDTHAYFTNWRSSGIFRVARAGGAIEPVATGHAQPQLVTLDDTSVYWVTRDTGALWKAPKPP